MAAADVQSKSSTISDGGANSFAITLTSAAGANALIVGTVHWSGSTDLLTSVTDEKGNSYTLIEAQLNIAGDSISAKSFYKEGITNNPQTVTANFSGTPAHRGMTVREASGVATSTALEQHTSQVQSAPGTGADAVKSGAVVTVADGQYIYGSSMDVFQFLAGTTFSAGTNFLAISSDGAAGTKFPICSEYLIQATHGSINATFTEGGGAGSDNATTILTFKAAAGGVGIAIYPYGA